MTSSVVVRRVSAVPQRRAGDAWRTVVDLLAAPGTAAHDELIRASGPAAMLIAQETTADGPIVATADNGPRVRIYTLHGERAFDGDADETPLGGRPCDRSSWHVSLPCPEDDLEDVSASLAATPNVSARPAGQDNSPSNVTSARTARHDPLIVDRSQLRQP